MKRWLPFIAIACTAIWVVVYNEHHKTDVDANPRSILYTVADTGREITRAPARLTRMSDEDEIRIGNQLAGGKRNNAGCAGGRRGRFEVNATARQPIKSWRGLARFQRTDRNTRLDYQPKTFRLKVTSKASGARSFHLRIASCRFNSTTCLIRIW